MKFMFPRVSLAVLLLAVASLVFATGSAAAQSKKSVKDTKNKKAVAAKATTKSKATKKETAKQTAKNTRDSKNKKQAAQDKRQKEKERLAAAKSKKDTRSKDPKSKLSRTEQRKAEAERRRKEAERRAAIEAERRRREQARREAIARAIAFEKGLRTETVANIAKDVTEGEDLNIRNVAVNALGEHAGSVVVMEAQTGKVMTIVNQDWAVRSGIKPCSVIKLVTGVAGLNEGVIDKENGALRTSNLALDDALAFSNNPYFQRAGVTFGNEKMISYAKELGLGEPTGINLEGEFAGKLPYGNSNPRIYSHGDDFEVTGVQLAVMVSAIANGGKRVLPRYPRNTVEKASFQTFYKDTVDVPTKSVRRVIPGMMGAAAYGTARRNMDQTLGVAGKTGSCISKGTWVGLFASVAPIEQPKYAVVVITRGRSERGRIAAAVAAQIYNALAKNIVRTNRNLALTEFNIQPKGGLPVTTATAAVADEEDDDTEEAATDAAAAPAGKIIVVPAVTAAPKKLVTKTADSKPTFPPVVITYDKEAKEQSSPQKP